MKRFRILTRSALALLGILAMAATTPRTAHSGACATLPFAIVKTISVGPATARVVYIRSASQITSLAGSMGGNVGGCGYDTVFSSIEGQAAFLVTTGGAGTYFTTGQRCTFGTLMGGICVIRGDDGLPVELLRFGVE